ncbi:MAG TPA: hypothetical protein VLA32_05825 [Anaerolineales bacterium]|jgi:hypothetical protein|nr:hypothetical protein [Anaerolineales bacterium]
MNRFKFNLRSPVATVVTIAAGGIMLLTYLMDLQNLQTVILDVVMIGAATALVIGVVNLFSVHVNKIRTGDSGAVGSAALVVALVVTFLVTMAEEITTFYPDSLPGADWILNTIQVPVESALMGVMAITLVYAAARLVTLRPNIFSVLFVLTLLLTMIISTQMGLDSGMGQGLRNFLVHGLASGGARGILIGVALGTIATGLRVLMGFDRPYDG